MPNTGINAKSGTIIIETKTIATELAAGYAEKINLAKNAVQGVKDLIGNVLQMAHKEQKQSSGSTTKGGARAKRHEKGETHGSLSSKQGNRPNPNKRKGAENRGGKKK